MSDANPSHDVVDHLRAQHHQISEVLAQLRSAPSIARGELFEQLVSFLAVHEQAERQVVAPYLDWQVPLVPGWRPMLAELARGGIADPGFRPRLEALCGTFAEHTAYVEREEFARLRRTVPGDLLRRLAEQL
ncbi:hypothetical protein Cs7R123_54930 [Catellatospora sp. TT07R-123]|uniref:hemerythrin domain-containing protein n=1 Tax=Catellatospora sp. TT07R-123 TaxID=2733863 RepID=UPI001B0A3B21|nr:hemerythrin domain-containing protein [Catellatospora sp. TT07R-123]GHJ48151.1 hypothetical protein Cs7R123_54930 [Catellatospora sp. TT07R-123]